MSPYASQNTNDPSYKRDSAQKKERALQMAEQKQMQEAYYKATPEEKRTGKFFKDLPLENMIDHEAIAYARQAGLTDPVFKTGRMSTALI